MSSKVKGPRWRGDPLPRGRHKLAPEAVRASQRERIVRAMLECVAERGYEATTVPQVVAVARVSRNAFYELFRDKTDCFIAVCDEGAAELLAELAALADEPDWVAAAREGVRRYLLWWQTRPALSKAYFLSLPAAGERAFEQRLRGYDTFRQVFTVLGGMARRAQPELAPLPDSVPQLLVHGITGLVEQRVRSGETDRLIELEDELTILIVRLLADDVTAVTLTE